MSCTEVRPFFGQTPPNGFNPDEVGRFNLPHPQNPDRLDEDERKQIPLTDSLGRKQETTIVNESGLYNVLLRLDKPEAKPFRKWVTSEVLPSIRKTGGYGKKALSPVEKSGGWSIKPRKGAAGCRV